MGIVGCMAEAGNRAIAGQGTPIMSDEFIWDGESPLDVAVMGHSPLRARDRGHLEEGPDSGQLLEAARIIARDIQGPGGR
jgi:hypothetical protein